MREIKIGRVYRHFKGDKYLVMGVAKHSETKEEMVLYKQLYGKGELWVRPKEMFLSPIDRSAHPNVPEKWRFTLQKIESKAKNFVEP